MGLDFKIIEQDFFGSVEIDEFLKVLDPAWIVQHGPKNEKQNFAKVRIFSQNLINILIFFDHEFLEVLWSHSLDFTDWPIEVKVRLWVLDGMNYEFVIVEYFKELGYTFLKGRFLYEE